MKLSEDFLADYFGVLHPGCSMQDKSTFSYAITGYESRDEYERDRQLLATYNTSAKTQDKFLIAHAAKVERTDPIILGVR